MAWLPQDDEPPQAQPEAQPKASPEAQPEASPEAQPEALADALPEALPEAVLDLSAHEQGPGCQEEDMLSDPGDAGCELPSVASSPPQARWSQF